jgi:putative oxidoreductase
MRGTGRRFPARTPIVRPPENNVNPLSLPALHRLAPLTPVVLRVGVGVVMAAHGWSKLTEMTPAGFGSGMLDGLGVPAPVLFGWIVTLVELVGGAALVLGALTRIAAAANALVLAGAVLLVKTDIGLIADMGAPLPGAELDIAMIVGLVGILLLGPGTQSVDHAVGVEARRPELVDA